MSTPSPRQILGCKVRAAREAYEHARRKPLGGGWEVPSREETYAYLAAEFGLSARDRATPVVVDGVERLTLPFGTFDAEGLA